MEKEMEDRVREMAYLMWEQAGRQMGMAAEFWLAAEREVLKTMSAMAGACAPSTPAEAEAVRAEPAAAPEPKPTQEPEAEAEMPKAAAAPAAKPEPAAEPAKAESKPKTTTRKTGTARGAKTKAS